MLKVPLTEGLVIGDVLETEEDKAIAGKELERGVSVRIFGKISREEVDFIMGEGKLVSSSLRAWQGEGLERKATIVINFSRQRKYWLRETVKMKKVQVFAIKMEQGTG